MNYSDFYYYGLCHVCKRSENLKRCSNCKYTNYCSTNHQKSDWLSHKGICKAISKTRLLIQHPINCSFEEWTGFRFLLSVKWSEILKRKLFPHEDQMWMFPPVCGLCFSEQIVFTCLNCLNVSYCSTEHNELHENTHKKYCEQLKLCMKIDIMLGKEKNYPTVKIAEIQKNTMIFPTNPEEVMHLFEDKCFLQKVWSEEEVLKYDILAPSAIILYALRASNLLKDRKILKPEIVIHIVGASNLEITFDWKTVTEALFHYIVNLFLFKCHLIGPNCNSDLLQCINHLEYCTRCINLRKTTELKVHSQVYHKVQPVIEKPDLIILFNSGLHEYQCQEDKDTWRESIPFLTSMKNVPIVLTAYTKTEIVRDVERLHATNTNLKFLVENEKNPFASLRPFRDWNNKKRPVFYCNKYISIVQQA